MHTFTTYINTYLKAQVITLLVSSIFLTHSYFIVIQAAPIEKKAA